MAFMVTVADADPPAGRNGIVEGDTSIEKSGSPTVKDTPIE
jgi:hypothetical protein